MFEKSDIYVIGLWTQNLLQSPLYNLFYCRFYYKLLVD